MYQGSHSINMDAKGRMAVPTCFRDLLHEQCEGRVVITANPTQVRMERCLLVFPEPRWKELLPSIEKLSSFERVERRVQRILLGNAKTIDLDGNGRILMPPTLREFAGLEKKLMLAGMGNKLELWSEDRWDLYMNDDFGDEEFSENIKSLAL